MGMLVEVITPERNLYSGQAKIVVLPGEEGELGVMPRHVRMIVALKAGNVTVTPADGGPDHVFSISGGVAEITGETCAVLAESVIEDSLAA